MFSQLLSRLTASPDTTTPERSGQIALAALLVHVARADGEYNALEVAQIEAALSARYDLDAEAATELRRDAEDFEREAPDTVRFTRAIKASVTYEDRQKVLVDLWAVALADGGRDAEENALMRLVSNLLGVNDRDSALARQQAQI